MVAEPLGERLIDARVTKVIIHRTRAAPIFITTAQVLRSSTWPSSPSREIVISAAVGVFGRGLATHCFEDEKAGP